MWYGNARQVAAQFVQVQHVDLADLVVSDAQPRARDEHSAGRPVVGIAPAEHTEDISARIGNRTCAAGMGWQVPDERCSSCPTSRRDAQRLPMRIEDY